MVNATASRQAARPAAERFSRPFEQIQIGPRANVLRQRPKDPCASRNERLFGWARRRFWNLLNLAGRRSPRPEVNLVQTRFNYLIAPGAQGRSGSWERTLMTTGRKAAAVPHGATLRRPDTVILTHHLSTREYQMGRRKVVACAARRWTFQIKKNEFVGVAWGPSGVRGKSTLMKPDRLSRHARRAVSTGSNGQKS